MNERDELEEGDRTREGASKGWDKQGVGEGRNREKEEKKRDNL